MDGWSKYRYFLAFRNMFLTRFKFCFLGNYLNSRSDVVGENKSDGSNPKAVVDPWVSIELVEKKLGSDWHLQTIKLLFVF